jgi:hypothetical protein
VCGSVGVSVCKSGCYSAVVSPGQCRYMYLIEAGRYVANSCTKLSRGVVLQWCHKSGARVSQGRHKCVTRVSHRFE